MSTFSPPPQSTKTSRQPTTIAFLLAYGAFFTGLFLIMVSVAGSEILHWPVPLVAFVRDVGLLLSAVIAGTLLHEKLLRDEMVSVVAKELDRKLASIPSTTAEEAHRLFSERPPMMTGLKLVRRVRRGFEGYYEWVLPKVEQELFFAGRSVLHRIDADLRTRFDLSAEQVLFRRLKDGCKIKILLLDPRTDIVARLASEEGESVNAMLGNIATSIGIVKRLYDLLGEDHRHFTPTANLAIRVYDRMPYFAYHRQDDRVTIGFYFLSNVGLQSAAYEIVDDLTKVTFQDHFVQIFAEARERFLIDFDAGRDQLSFNEILFDALCERFSKVLGEDEAKRLLTRP